MLNINVCISTNLTCFRNVHSMLYYTFDWNNAVAPMPPFYMTTLRSCHGIAETT